MTELQRDVLETIRRQGPSDIEWLAMLVDSTPRGVARAVSQLSKQSLAYRYDNIVCPTGE